VFSSPDTDWILENSALRTVLANGVLNEGDRSDFIYLIADGLFEVYGLLTPKPKKR
jgi:hypothetical protein